MWWCLIQLHSHFHYGMRLISSHVTTKAKSWINVLTGSIHQIIVEPILNHLSVPPTKIAKFLLYYFIYLFNFYLAAHFVIDFLWRGKGGKNVSLLSNDLVLVFPFSVAFKFIGLFSLHLFICFMLRYFGLLCWWHSRLVAVPIWAEGKTRAICRRIVLNRQRMLKTIRLRRKVAAAVVAAVLAAVQFPHPHRWIFTTRLHSLPRFIIFWILF